MLRFFFSARRTQVNAKLHSLAFVRIGRLVTAWLFALVSLAASLEASAAIVGYTLDTDFPRPVYATKDAALARQKQKIEETYTSPTYRVIANYCGAYPAPAQGEFICWTVYRFNSATQRYDLSQGGGRYGATYVFGTCGAG